jgi:MFS superfamily sulfate permease-like transporter
LIIVSEMISARIPGALIGLVGAAVSVVAFGLERRGVSVLGVVPSTLPGLAVPSLAPEHLRALVPLSLLIAIVVMVQTAATTQSFPSETNQPPDVDRDFCGVGAGSIFAGLFAAFPVNASPPRTGIVAETGGQSQLAGLFAAALVLAILAFGATLLRHVPEAALGGVLLFVATRIVRVRQIAQIFRETLSELLLVVATAVAIIVLPIEQGVAIGIILSLLQGVWSVTRARVIDYEHVPDTTVWWPLNPHHPGERDPDIIVAGFQAPLSFLNASHFRADMLQLVRSAPQRPKLLVIEASGILEVDFTAAQILIDLIKTCHRDGIVVAFARLESLRAQQAFSRFHIDDVVGKDHIFLSVDQAVRALPHLTIPT